MAAVAPRRAMRSATVLIAVRGPASAPTDRAARPELHTGRSVGCPRFDSRHKAHEQANAFVDYTRGLAFIAGRRLAAMDART
jgi:hypothetical protein